MSFRVSKVKFLQKVYNSLLLKLQGVASTTPEVPYNTTDIISSILTIQVTIVTAVVPLCSNEGHGTI